MVLYLNTIELSKIYIYINMMGHRCKTAKMAIQSPNTRVGSLILRRAPLGAPGLRAPMVPGREALHFTRPGPRQPPASHSTVSETIISRRSCCRIFGNVMFLGVSELIAPGRAPANVIGPADRDIGQTNSIQLSAHDIVLAQQCISLTPIINNYINWLESCEKERRDDGYPGNHLMASCHDPHLQAMLQAYDTAWGLMTDPDAKKAFALQYASLDQHILGCPGSSETM